MKKKVFEIDFSRVGIPGMISMAALRLEALADRYFFKPYNLSSASFRILAIIDYAKESTPTEIMKYIGGSKSNVTQRLNFLNRLGLVSSSKDRIGDGRSLKVRLTPAGKKLLREIKSIINKHNLKLDAFFTPEETVFFQKFINKIMFTLDSCEKKLVNMKN